MGREHTRFTAQFKSARIKHVTDHEFRADRKTMMAFPEICLHTLTWHTEVV